MKGNSSYLHTPTSLKPAGMWAVLCSPQDLSLSLLFPVASKNTKALTIMENMNQQENVQCLPCLPFLSISYVLGHTGHKLEGGKQGMRLALPPSFNPLLAFPSFDTSQSMTEYWKLAHVFILEQKHILLSLQKPAISTTQAWKVQ